MTTADDRLSQLRQQLADSVTRLAELDVAAIDAIVACWHQADIKLGPLLGRYGVESGHHRLVMSISAFDAVRYRPCRSSVQTANAG